MKAIQAAAAAAAAVAAASVLLVQAVPHPEQLTFNTDKLHITDDVTTYDDTVVTYGASHLSEWCALSKIHFLEDLKSNTANDWIVVMGNEAGGASSPPLTSTILSLSIPLPFLDVFVAQQTWIRWSLRLPWRTIFHTTSANLLVLLLYSKSRMMQLISVLKTSSLSRRPVWNVVTRIS